MEILAMMGLGCPDTQVPSLPVLSSQLKRDSPQSVEASSHKHLLSPPSAAETAYYSQYPTYLGNISRGSYQSGMLNFLHSRFLQEQAYLLESKQSRSLDQRLFVNKMTAPLIVS